VVRIPVPLWISAAIGLIVTLLGAWRAAVTYGPPLPLLSGLVVLALTGLAIYLNRRAVRSAAP
jgi:hypothetical protein